MSYVACSIVFFFSSRRRHTRFDCDWSSDVCSSDLLSGRLGDVLSHVYMTSAMLKRYHDEGAPQADQPLLAWAFHDSVHKIEESLSAALRNFPIRPIGWLMWALIFPLGRRAEAPGDRLSRR